MRFNMCVAPMPRVSSSRLFLTRATKSGLILFSEMFYGRFKDQKG